MRTMMLVMEERMRTMDEQEVTMNSSLAGDLAHDGGDDEDDEGAACQPSTMDHHLLACSLAWGGEEERIK